MSIPSQHAGIVVTGVARSFGSVHAVRDVSLEARPGEVTALIGPNGSGKTTLMLMLASLLAPDRGTISVGGFDPSTDAEAVRNTMGWMPDILGSWASLTVRTTLILTGRLYRLGREEAASRADQLIGEIGLDELAHQPTRVLSRGQKQKLSLARALVHDPSVLLLDEPASGLDPGARIELRQLVRQFAAQGKTILVSSHVLAELEEMADTAVYVAGGVTASTESVARALATARPWRIKLADGGDLTAALLAAGVPTSAISTDRGELLVPFANEADAAALLAALVAAGARVSTFAPAVGDLEHAFLDLNRTNPNRTTPTEGAIQ
jgi:ABC-type multidrug transport system ATPase subunit